MGLRLEIEGWRGEVVWGFPVFRGLDGWMEGASSSVCLPVPRKGLNLEIELTILKSRSGNRSKRRVTDVAVIRSLVYFEWEKGWGRYGRFSSIELRRGSDTFFF
jgi:hypothetical protein